MQLLPALALAVALSSPAVAGDTEPRPVTIGQRFELSSNALEGSVAVDVHLPPGYGDTFERSPILFVLDPEYHFQHVAATADHLARARVIPPLIVVGVHSADRRRDLTPTKIRKVAGSGGADRLLAFLADELTPWLNDHYRTAPYRIVYGQSFGGLFGVHALATRPDAIHACIAVEPKLQWDDRVVLRSLEASLASRETWRGVLHLARAGEGSKPDPVLDSALVLEASRLPDGFELSQRVYEGETPSTVALVAAREGLRTLYHDWPSEPVSYQTKLTDLTAQYALLSERFGYPIPVPELDLNVLGYRLLYLDRVEEAVAVFERNVATWPESANVYDSLGDALARLGDLERALENYTEACLRAKAQDSPLLEVYEENRERTRTKLDQAR